MKVRELIEMLSKVDQDLHVYYEYPSGDYWRTKIAGEVNSLDAEGAVEWSSYHDRFRVLSWEEREEAIDRAIGGTINAALVLSPWKKRVR